MGNEQWVIGNYSILITNNYYPLLIAYYPLFKMANSKEYSWKNLTVVILGKTITGIQNIEYKVTKEKDYVRGRGNEPLGIQNGNKSYEGSMELLRSEYDLLVLAAKAANPNYDVTDISFDIIECFELPSVPNKINTNVLAGAEFKEASFKMGQGDMTAMVTLPFMFLRLIAK
jgi:hypothetical protein